MRTAVVKVTNQLGLHARPAKIFVKTAQNFCSNIFLLRPGSDFKANAKSILAVLALGASQGTELELRAEGADEAEALCALESLFAQNLLETEE